MPKRKPRKKFRQVQRELTKKSRVHDSRLLRVKNTKQLTFAHAIVHSRKYRKSVGKSRANSERATLHRAMRDLGMKVKT